MGHAAKVSPELVARMVVLQRKGRTQERIAEELGLSRPTVSKFLARYNRAAAKRLEDRAVQERARQLDQLDWIADEAVQHWERAHEAPLLAQARGALADKRSLLGLDAPDQVEHGGEITIRVEYKDAPARPAAPREIDDDE